LLRHSIVKQQPNKRFNLPEL